MVRLDQSGTGLHNLVAVLSQPRRTRLSTSDYRTPGHQSTTTLMSNNRITIMTSTRDVFLVTYQVLALDRCRLVYTNQVML